jgi:hypothetical protein
MQDILEVLDGVYYILCCKKPDFLQLSDEIYEVLGNWWYSNIHPASIHHCRIDASTSHASMEIKYNPNLSNNIIEKRGKIKRQCTWEVTVSSKEESRQYYFATKEGFSQIMSTAIKDMIEFGKEAKYSKRSFESFL